MVYNQELSRNIRVNVRKGLIVSQENKLIFDNSKNIPNNIKFTCVIKKAFANSIKNNRIAEESWVQC
ncbi:MAG: hypothetical protein H6Q70_1987 [Firmicutes bacterium]|nr:hypothetical protein [Bacillota bacterium]